MRIAVIGSGAIGCLVAAYLKEKGQEVTLIGHNSAVKAIKDKGVFVSGVRGNFLVYIGISDTLNYIPDLVILATKTQDINSAMQNNSHLMQNSLLLTIQNGVQADNLVARYLSAQNIISSIVMFGATSLAPGKVVHNFEGSWVLGNFFNHKLSESMLSVSLILDKAFPTVISEDIKGAKYLKIFVNANNCLPAIIGKSMQEVFSDLIISRISIAIWKEAFKIIDRVGIGLVSLPGFPVENLTKLTSMPDGLAAQVFSQQMSSLSKEPLYGSILQSIMRGSLSEIDYINGEFVRLAEENNMPAPLNRALVDMVHAVEKNGRFFSKDDLIQKTKDLI
ncbi:MAG: 2-dehydropantoate 2-reductase [Candidatus Omnitrophica bacterium]|nr:2-dehydropantoate 2-reductase [Candidatus Omnitrophota bacterium]